MKFILQIDQTELMVFDADNKKEFIKKFPCGDKVLLSNAYDEVTSKNYSHQLDGNISFHLVLIDEGNYYIVDEYKGEEFLCYGGIMKDGSLDLEIAEVEVIGEHRLKRINAFFNVEFIIPVDIYDNPCQNPKWLDNSIQFPRLIAEINGIGLTDEMYDLLCESMDLTSDEVDELFERAEAEWQKIKNNV
jgi:hypothetical protein